MKKFLFDIFCFACLLSLLPTLVFWARSAEHLDVVHGWWMDGPAQSRLHHVYLQATHGQIEIYWTQSERANLMGLPVSWPTNLRPNYAPTEIQNYPADRPDWTYANSFAPIPRPYHGFYTAYERQVTPAERTVFDSRRWKVNLAFLNADSVREDRWLVAFPYGALAAVLVIPLGWQLFYGTKRGAKKTTPSKRPPPGAPPVKA